MNKRKKVNLLIIFILIILLFLNVNYAKAINTEDYKDITKTSDMGGISTFAGQILYIAQFIGYSIAVIMLAIMGIQYIISSPEQRADLKSRLIPYGIGALLLFAGATILSIIYNIVNG